MDAYLFGILLMRFANKLANDVPGSLEQTLTMRHSSILNFCNETFVIGNVLILSTVFGFCFSTSPPKDLTMSFTSPVDFGKAFASVAIFF